LITITNIPGKYNATDDTDDGILYIGVEVNANGQIRANTVGSLVAGLLGSTSRPWSKIAEQVTVRNNAVTLKFFNSPAGTRNGENRFQPFLPDMTENILLHITTGY
jgi:hypothetical protein